MIKESDDSLHGQSRLGIHRVQLAVAHLGDDEGAVHVPRPGRDVVHVLGLPGALDLALQLAEGLVQRVEAGVGVVALRALGHAPRDHGATRAEGRVGLLSDDGEDELEERPVSKHLPGDICCRTRFKVEGM